VLAHFNLHSEALGTSTSLYVALPQGSPLEATGRFAPFGGNLRTLFLLHGRKDDHSAWVRRTSIERYAEGKGLAVVMPDAGLSYYADMVHGPDYFAYITEELPLLIRSILPLTLEREGTYVAGLSMGGYGAVKAALRRPDLISRAGSFSGTLDLAGWIRLCRKNGNLRVLKILENSFGEPDSVTGTGNDVLHLLRELKASGKQPPHIYQCCGTADLLHDVNLSFREFCAREDVPVTYDEWPGGHDWAFWDEAIRRFLAWLP
jgi:putative tributyrin esterase